MNKPQLAVPNEIRWIHETRDMSTMEQYRSTVHEKSFLRRKAAQASVLRELTE
jgi:hypothetical protein